MKIPISILLLIFGLCVFLILAIPYGIDIEYKRGVHNGKLLAFTPIDNIEMFRDKLECFDEDIYLTWIRKDGARIQICIRGDDREMYIFSRPSLNQPEYIRVSDAKPLWYEDGSFGYKEIE